MTDGFVVEVRRPDGAAIIRRRLNRTAVAATAGAAALLVALLVVAYVRLTCALGAASDQVARLNALRALQQGRLAALERQTQSLQRRNRESQRLVARVLRLRRLAMIARTRMLAAIPSLNPVNGSVSAAFGPRTDPWPEFHRGLDLAADYGTVVRAAADGTVAAAGWDGGYGIKIDIDHQNGYHTWYCHLSHVEVRPGQHVVRGEPIAAVGTTGESTGPHLHYQVMHDGVAIDPMPYLNGVPAAVLATLPAAARVQ